MAGIYIHIPFCKQACHYCDFHFSTSLKNKNDFLFALEKEIDLRYGYLDNKKIGSIYFGGGTPSLLSAAELNNIIHQLKKYFSFTDDIEITLEANPDDLSEKYLQSLRTAPVNRLSIGIQSFNNDDLKYMNRVHDAKEALQSVSLAAQAGFKNLSIDLIYGTPTMSNEQWKKNLELAFSLPVNHLSCYSLTVEPKTALATMIKKKKSAPVNELKSAEQFEMLMQLCREAGFTQYEISNFCRDGFFSKHNSSYWKGEYYLGLGPSAHSFNGLSRQWNISDNTVYIKSLLESEIKAEKEILTTNQKYNEVVMTSLRTTWGLSLEKIRNTFGDTFAEYLIHSIEPYCKSGMVTEKENIFYLSEQGKLLADKITSDLFKV